MEATILKMRSRWTCWDQDTPSKSPKDDIPPPWTCVSTKRIAFTTTAASWPLRSGLLTVRHPLNHLPQRMSVGEPPLAQIALGHHEKIGRRSRREKEAKEEGGSLGGREDERWEEWRRKQRGNLSPALMAWWLGYTQGTEGKEEREERESDSIWATW